MNILGLRVRIDGHGAAADRASEERVAPDGGSRRQDPLERVASESRDIDLDVSLLGGAEWPAELLVAPEHVCYTDEETDEAGQPTLIVSQCGRDLYRLRYWDRSEFLVDRAGSRAWARWPAILPVGEILTCLFGPIAGFVLNLRGTPCLHASAVVIDGRAVAFLGHSGAGKSTTAAAFVRRGFAALTDDVLALERKLGALKPAEEYLVRPGHNVVRLAPDAVRALYGAEDALPHGGDTTDKRHLELTADGNRLPAGPVPLDAIYVLHERRPDLDRPVAIDDLKGHEALMALVARTFMNYVLDAGLRTRALDVFSRLAARVPVRKLTVRDDASDLGAVTDAILADVRRRRSRG